MKLIDKWKDEYINYQLKRYLNNDPKISKINNGATCSTK